MTASSLFNFGRPMPPGRGSAAGRKVLAPPYFSQRAVFASPRSAFSARHVSAYWLQSLISMTSVLLLSPPNTYHRLTIFLCNFCAHAMTHLVFLHSIQNLLSSLFSATHIYYFVFHKVCGRPPQYAQPPAS